MTHTQSLKRNYILAGLLLSTFLAAIEGTVIGPAGPSIIGDLGGVELLSWVFTAYLLTMAVSTPLFGKMSDLFGRRIVFTISSLLFLTGSLLSGLAQNMEQLILFRAIQGIGAGGLNPVIFTIIGDIFSMEERAKVQAWISSVWGISSLIGPLLGGYVVDYLNWRWIFVFNLPFGLLSLWFIIKYLRENRAPRKVKIDVAGTVTFTAGVTSLLIVLATGGQQFAWDSPWLLGLLTVAVISLIVFFFVELRTPEPMIPLKLFRIRDIAFSNLASLIASALLIGLISYMPLWIQGVLGLSATMSGLILAPMSLCWMLGSVLGSRWIISRGSRFTSVIGMLIIAAGAAGMVTLTQQTPIFMILIFNALYGLGFGFCFSVFTIIAQSSVGYPMRGASTALNSFTKSIGQTVAVTVFGALINWRISAGTVASSSGGGETRVSQRDIDYLLSPDKLHLLPRELWDQLREILAGGLHSLFVVMGVLGAIGVICGFGLRKESPRAEEPGDSE